MRTLLAVFAGLAIACGDTTTTTTAEVAPAAPEATAAQATAPAAEPEEVTQVKYVCPMCEGIENEGPGECPTCGMALVKADEADGADPHADCPHHKAGAEGEAHEHGEDCPCKNKGEHEGHEGHEGHADCPHHKAEAEAEAAAPQAEAAPAAE